MFFKLTATTTTTNHQAPTTTTTLRKHFGSSPWALVGLLQPMASASTSVSMVQLVKGFFGLFRFEKSPTSAASPSARVHAHSASFTRSSHHDGAVPRDDLWVQIMTDDDPYFWHRQQQTAVWSMPPGTRPAWVRSRDGLFVHVETGPTVKVPQIQSWSWWTFPFATETGTLSAGYGGVEGPFFALL